MKKDTVYSLRLNRKVRAALKKAAGVKCRTMASLLDKIITDYLKKEGFLTRTELGQERRRFLRESIPLTSRVFVKKDEKTESIPSVVRDISPGGVKLIFPKDVEEKITKSALLPYFDLRVDLLKASQPLCFECDMRHLHKTDSEIQIGASFENTDRNEIQKLRGCLH